MRNLGQQLVREIIASGCDADACRSLQRRGDTGSNSALPTTGAPRPGPCRAIHLLQKRLRRPPAQGRGLARAVAGRVGGGGWARLYKLPYSISSSAPAMTLGGIELSANGSIRPKPAFGCMWHIGRS
jgi:hypothetical protein